MLHALSIDVEEFYNAEALKPYLDGPADTLQRRAEASTARLLDLLDEHHTKATFFVLGHLAEEQPDLVKRIAERGHEIACHHYNHDVLWEQSTDRFRDELNRAKHVLEDLAGAPVVGYRAPSFSIVDRTMWVLDVLLEAGFEYDSSIFPIHHDRYGVPNAPRFIHVVRRNGDNELLEFPPSTLELFRLRIPVGGGGYLRQYPLFVSRAAIARLEQQGHSAMVYVHPWELDPDQPRLPVPFLTRMRHYRNLETMEGRLRKLLRSFSFAPCARILAVWKQN